MQKNNLLKTLALSGIVVVVTVLFSSSVRITSNYFFTHHQLASVSKILQSDLVDRKSGEENTQDLYTRIILLNKEIAKVVSNENKDIEPGNSSESTSTTLELKDLFSQRARLLSRLAKNDPKLFLSATFSANLKAKIPQELQGGIETSFSETGELEVLRRIKGDSRTKGNNGDLIYYLIIKGKRIPLFLTGEINTLSGSTVNVRGFKIEDYLVADKGSVTILSAAAPIVSVDGLQDRKNGKRLNMAAQVVNYVSSELQRETQDRRVLVLLLNYANLPQQPFVSSFEVEQAIFGGFPTDFYKEQSYDLVSFTGDTEGWYSLPETCDSNNLAPGGGAPWNSMISSVVAQNNIDLGNYNQIIILNNCDIANSEVTIGLASVGNTIVTDGANNYRMPVTWMDISEPSFEPHVIHPFDFTDFDHVLSMGMGFNFGLEFSAGLDCGSDPFGGNCFEISNGNAFDIMGNGHNSLHFGAFGKDLLGWIFAHNSLLITQSGRYTINALESGLNDGSKKFAKIKVIGSQKTPFYLEYRKGIGYDSKLNNEDLVENQNGLIINYVTPRFGNLYLPKSRLLDMSPSASGWEQDTENATLKLGERFDDEASGITIGPVIAVNESSITFDVGVGQPVCIRDAPLLDEPYVIPSHLAPGDSGHVYVYFDNGDTPYCPNSSIRLDVEFPQGWSSNIPAPNPVFAPPNDYGFSDGNASIRRDVTYAVPINATTTIYSVNVIATNESTGQQVSREIYIDVGI